jgi:hypothetical protein
MDERTLAAFQDDLLRSLEHSHDPADVSIALSTHNDPVLRRWIASWDPDLVELACELVDVWTARSEPPTPT